MSTFPTDVISDILRRIPVKTLVRFKCVSKPWDSLIDDSDFAKLHLHYSFKTNNARLVLDTRREVDDKTYLVDFDSLGNLEQLPRPFTTELSGFRSRIFGSCNGLLAVYHHEAGIALWNPSTRKCHYLPTLICGDEIEENDHIHGFGFGYDVIGNDYKVVLIIVSGTVMVYSLKANSWRKIKDCPYNIYHQGKQDSAYANGSLHWVGDEKGKYFGGRLIFALDLGVEEYHEVPECDINFRNFVYKNVGVLGGCLYVFREYTNVYDEDHIILWVMKEYGVKESWSEILYLSLENSRTSVYHTRAIAYSKSGDRILLDDNGINGPAWYNLERKTGELFHIPGAPPCFSPITYVESLVSVNDS